MTWPNGWKCSACGAWVQQGTSHACQWNTTPIAPTSAPDPTWQLIQALYNVQKELQRIAEALEKHQP